MLYKILVFLLVIISISFTKDANASNIYYNYAKSFGSTGLDFGTSTALDSNGNIYFTGVFSGTVDFDPGDGVFNLTSNGDGDGDVYVVKLDSSGDFVWAKSVGGTSTDKSFSIAVDSSNYAYVVGGFLGTADFDPGSGTTNLTAVNSTAGARDVFILKLDSSGDFVWAKSVGGPGDNVRSFFGDDWAQDITIDSSNNLYITGAFGNTVDFDPGAGTANLSTGGGTGQDAFILKLDSSGNYVWAKKMGGGGWGDSGYSIALDINGNIYTTGNFGGNSLVAVDFNPGVGTFNLTPVGTLDIFVQKLDSSGDFVWAKSMGGTGVLNYGRYIAVDSNGNVYTAGSLGSGSATDFDPGAGTFNLTSNGTIDIFVQKLDSSGDFVWAKSFGNTQDDWAQEIGIDSSNNIYIAGSFINTIDFDSGAGTTILDGGVLGSGYILKLDASGDLVYVKQFTGSGGSRVNAMYVDSSGTNVYVTGYLTATVDFDPGAGTANLTSNGDLDSFVVRLGPDIVSPIITSVGSSNITNTSATINWTTDEASTSMVEYGTSTSYGSSTPYEDIMIVPPVTSHSINLTGLNSCTTYYYRVKSNDSSSNLGISNGSSFSTSGCGVVPVWILQKMSDDLRAEQSKKTEDTKPVKENKILNKFYFNKNLQYKSNNTEVKELQKFLNSKGFLVSKNGIGSIGNESTYFGPATKKALINFQKANNIKPAIGNFGPKTRAKINSLD